jgi:arabinogalactan oligomer/maltooligosaccharide transport system substrate-binding protein
MLHRSKLLTLVLLLVVSVLFTACAPNRSTNEGNNQTVNGNETVNASESANANQTAADEDKPEQLLLWANNENQLDVLDQITKKYTEKTGIKVVVEVTPDIVQKLPLAAPAGNGPDLFYQPHDILGNMLAQGLVVPLEMDEATRNGYTKGALDAATYGGKLYGAPAVIETYTLYYNKSLVPTPPASYDDILKLGQQLTHPKEDKFAFMMTPDIYYVYSFVSNYGGYIFGGQAGNYDAADLGLNNAGAIEGLTKFQEFYKQAQIPQTISIDVMDTLFTEGKVGMVVNGPWTLATYKEKLGDKLGTAVLPQVNGKPSPSFIGVKSWFVSAYSKSQKWAADLALFMTNDENSKLYYELEGELPPRPAILDQLDDPVAQGFFDQIQYGTPMPNIPEMSQIWAVDNALDFIIKGEDVKSVMDESVTNIKTQIDAGTK